MSELSESDRIYIRELKRTMEYYRRIVYAVMKAKKGFREAEKNVVENILAGGPKAKGNRENPSAGVQQDLFSTPISAVE